ncbi:alkaline phosphatase family protein [Pelotomaculum propionicicum]|uniref:Nucleotide pyrophosphatase n=1 Tax=Pelotomaculum propionicicum TaxID=258475 RepID=A0A4Y7RVC9_9FIRM|nr:alkaline phosphatase family protein [Pelotomaculum propionicicum]NLI11117.1 alkaline phosphatase family protein [Peptococcaceae bacterium]TEB12935.1 hypothetical protein Pmgp_00573 [Pelotomaculum propionicicum]
MSLSRKALADKILVLGIDGMDPKLTKKYVAEGKMPNTKKFIERGAQREDLVMLGAQPTVTPPMWTTLATGAYPVTHGITCFYRQSKDSLDVIEYNLDSSKCQAEQLWNVFAEAGKKTLVWHWPGSSWPPTSTSPNLSVVDGTQPGNVNMGVAIVDPEKILVASVKTEEVTYKKQAATEGEVPCVISDLKVQKSTYNLAESVKAKKKTRILLTKEDGEGALPETPFDVVYSPIKDAAGWADAPADAREFTMLHAGGLIRRPCLILKNADGVYDRVAIYKSKKETEPMAVLEQGVYVRDLLDEAIKDDDKKVIANRNMRILYLEPNGEQVRMWISAGMDTTNDDLWHPASLFKTVTENIAFPQPTCLIGNASVQIARECMIATWQASADWQADVLNYLIEKENFEIIFSHFHNVDLAGHMIIHKLKKGGKGTPEDYKQMLEDVYRQTDGYIGRFLHLLDEGWTVLIVSDHAAVCPEHNPPLIGDMTGLNVTLMRELGFTNIKQDAEGNDLKEIDWAKTKAVANRGNHIYLNIKGRDKYGIVEPEDQYEVEEEIMTALYGYKDSVTGKRVIAMALRNKDAVLLGLGGPESGDIIYWTAEGYNYDHCDSLSTTCGYGGTSVSPIFMAAGPGFKTGFKTDRIIREVDVAPTVAVIGGVRMPAQCEGAPVYQILSEEF